MSPWSLVVGMLIPRVVTLILYFVGYFQGTVHVAVVALGLIFLPTTLLWYGVIQRSFAGEWGMVQVVGLAVALLIDFGPLSARRKVQAPRS